MQHCVFEEEQDKAGDRTVATPLIFVSSAAGGILLLHI
jgi:hypothetical protein